MKRGIKIYPLIIVGVIMLWQFFSAEKFTNPDTGKKVRVGMSPDKEKALGLQAYNEVLSKADVLESGPEVELVTAVAQRLAPQTGDGGKGFDWRVSVVRSPQKNAFCLPGGKIVVYTGILAATKTEAGLAAVMGHEMAHATARHGSQRVFQSTIAQTAMIGASLSIGDLDPRQRQTVMALLGAGAQYGVLMPFGRQHESEADEVGLLYMARAGYDPREAISFWERMAEGSQGQPPEFMSTHPSHGTRVQRLKEFMPEAVKEYEQARRNR